MIDIVEEPVHEACDCGGGTTTRLTRFVHKDGDAYILCDVLSNPISKLARLHEQCVS
jgi:hypothetical protein